MPEAKRPGFSLYIDEFQNFATPDLGQMFTEGRKYKVRVCLAHQYREQLPKDLRHATLMAGTKICFQLSHEDASEMAHSYVSGEETVKPEDIESRPVEYLLRETPANRYVQTFVETYLVALQSQRRGGKIEIQHPGARWDHGWYWIFNAKPPEGKLTVDDPTLLLNRLLYEVMKTGNAQVRLDPRIVYGFSNVGLGFYPTFLYARNKQSLLDGDHDYPSPMIIEGANGLYCARPPDSPKEQMYHFLFHLRATMWYLANHPIGKKSRVSSADIARDLTLLPKRAAYVRSGETTGVIYTDDNPASVSEDMALERLYLVRGQTRDKYCAHISPAPLNDNPSPSKREGKAAEGPAFSRWEEVQ